MGTRFQIKDQTLAVTVSSLSCERERRSIDQSIKFGQTRIHHGSSPGFNTHSNLHLTIALASHKAPLRPRQVCSLRAPSLTAGIVLFSAPSKSRSERVKVDYQLVFSTLEEMHPYGTENKGLLPEQSVLQ